MSGMRKTRRSGQSLLPATEPKDTPQYNLMNPGKVVVYECKLCDMISTDENTMFDHVEESHRCSPRKRRISPLRGGVRSKALIGLLSVSIQKNVYKPNTLQSGEYMYTVYGCTLCPYQHPANAQVRKHGLMSHFLEIPVFTCVYCDSAVADRAVFDNHLQKKHPFKTVDFSFDCKALTLLNEFLSESIQNVNLKFDGFYEVIKAREKEFTHYAKETMSTLMPKASSGILDSLAEKTADLNKGTGTSLNKNLVKDLLKEMRQGASAQVRNSEASKEESLNISKGKDTENPHSGDALNEGTSQKDSKESPNVDFKEEETEEKTGNVEKTEKEQQAENERKAEKVEETTEGREAEKSEKTKREEKTEEVEQTAKKVTTEIKETAEKGEKEEEKEVVDKEGSKAEVEKTTPSRPVGRPPKRGRGRPRKSSIIEKPKEVVIAPKTVVSTPTTSSTPSTSSTPPTPSTPTASPGRYNLRLRSLNKSFSEEAEPVDTDDEDIVKRPKMTPKSEVKTVTPVFTTASPVILKPASSTQAPPGTKSFMMVQGKLVPIVTTPAPMPPITTQSVPQPVQLTVNQAARPQSLPPASVIQVQPQQIQQHQQPVRFNIQPQQAAPVFLNLGFPQAQQQLYPMMNQAVQQPLILQPGIQNQQLQLLQQNNTGLLPNIPHAIPLYLRPQGPGVFSLGGQLVGSNPLQNVLQQPAPVIMSTAGVGSSAATASATSVSASKSTANRPIAVKPIVIQPLDDTSVVDSSCNSDTDEDKDKVSKSDPVEPEIPPDVDSWYFECYVCRNCYRIHLSVVELEEHIVKDELHQNLPPGEYNSLRAIIEKHVLTTKIPVLKRGNDWDLPVFMCGRCDLVHVLESFIRKHTKIQHVESVHVKCSRRSLTSPSDLREMCVNGWSTALVSRCKPQPDWSLTYYKSRERLLGSDPELSGTSYKKVCLKELEKVDEEANPNRSSEVLQPVQHVKGSPHFGQFVLQPGQVPNFVRPAQFIQGVPQVQIVRAIQPVLLPGQSEQPVLAAQGAPQVAFQLPTDAQSSPFGPTSVSCPPLTDRAVVLHYGCMKCTFKDKSKEAVQQHVLQNHMTLFGPPYKCRACLTRGRSLQDIKNHIQKEHHTGVEYYNFAERLYDYEAAARSLISIYYCEGVSVDAGMPGSSSKAVVSTSEYVEPDSSCDVEMTTQPGPDKECDSTAPNLSGNISAPNILSCFSEEDVDGNEGLLPYNEKSLMHAVSSMDDMADPGTVEFLESENRTGEAYACRLCAYSCDTEARVKSHLMSHHISSDMYPFSCMNCSYESPSTLRLAQHVLYKHQKQMKKNPPKLAKEMERDKEIWSKIMRDESKYEKFQQELDCLFRNCVERC